MTTVEVQVLLESGIAMMQLAKDAYLNGTTEVTWKDIMGKLAEAEEASDAYGHMKLGEALKPDDSDQ